MHSILCHPLHDVAFSSHLYFLDMVITILLFSSVACNIIKMYSDLLIVFAYARAVNISWYCRLTFVTMDTFHT